MWLLFLLAHARADETVYAIEDLTSTRFPDADTPGPAIPAGTELTVLVREGERLRVRVSVPPDALGSATSAPKLQFGWIRSDQVTETPPETDPGAEIPAVP